MDIQSAVDTLVILTTISICMAYYNIKCLQIDQHRAWMLRAMFCLGTIITARIIMIISAKIITLIGDYYQVQRCAEIAFDYHGSQAKAVSLYPQCANSGPNTNLIVHANFNAGPESVGASLDPSFGMALWLSILMHLVGVEIYLNLTRAEGERLRNMSFERQPEAGMENPGSAALTSDRWGDMPVWQPARSSSFTPVIEK